MVIFRTHDYSFVAQKRVVPDSLREVHVDFRVSYVFRVVWETFFFFARDFAVAVVDDIFSILNNNFFIIIH